MPQPLAILNITCPVGTLRYPVLWSSDAHCKSSRNLVSQINFTIISAWGVWHAYNNAMRCFRDWSWIGVCCWHQLPSVLSRRAGWSPRGKTTWLIPIITWCWPFLFVSTNILLIKSKLKLESRAIAVGVAMSPRNLGGKYRCCPHPRSRKLTRQFFAGSRAC